MKRCSTIVVIIAFRGLPDYFWLEQFQATTQLNNFPIKRRPR